MHSVPLAQSQNPPARAAADSWREFPRSRWSFSHMREVLPTATVSRGPAPATPLPRAESRAIDALTFQPIGRAEPMTWEQSLETNYTDGILILHRGRIMYERYFGELNADRPHIAFSVSKSIVATLAATLIVEGALHEDATVAHYVPELGPTGVGDATLRQLLDMTTGLDFTEDYTDPQSSIWVFSRAGGMRTRPADYQGPESFFAFLKTLEKSAPHGETFSYKTVNTDTLAAVIARVAGMRLRHVLSERIFSRLGAEHDAFFTVDPTGVEFAGGGFNLTLRDLARFGEMVRLEGCFKGQQIVPAAAIADIRRGGDRVQFAQAGYATLPGWSYRNMWWISHGAHAAFMARGIHGQAIYIDPTAEMVIARFASHPLAANVNLDPTSLPAYEAVAHHLMGDSGAHPQATPAADLRD